MGRADVPGGGRIAAKIYQLFNKYALIEAVRPGQRLATGIKCYFGEPLLVQRIHARGLANIF